MLYNIHQQHDSLTHIHTYDNLTRLASKYLCIHRSCGDGSSVVYGQIFPTGRRQMF